MTHQPQSSRPDMLDMLFANRNKIYGAYQLRRQYPGYLARALGLCVLLTGFFLALMQMVSTAEKNKQYQGDTGPVIFCPAPAVDPKAAHAPPTLHRAPAQVRSTLRFVPPVVVRNEQVPDEQMNHSIETILNTRAEVGVLDAVGAAVPPGLPETAFSETGSGAAGQPDDRVYEMPDVQKNASFPGGEGALMAYLSREIYYPRQAREAGVEGLVALSFIVNIDGTISDIVVLKDPGAGCGKETVRVVRAMPYWIPAEANGRLVKVRFILPVRFELK